MRVGGMNDDCGIALMLLPLPAGLLSCYYRAYVFDDLLLIAAGTSRFITRLSVPGNATLYRFTIITYSVGLCQYYCGYFDEFIAGGNQVSSSLFYRAVYCHYKVSENDGADVPELRK